MTLEGLSPRQSRRHFFVGALRYAAMGSIAAVGALAVAKRRALVSQGVCINEGLCRGCPALAGCGLPPALDAQESVERGDHGQR